MNHADKSPRPFKVYARHVDRHHTRVVQEASFEAAAVAYLEDFDLSEPVDDNPEIRVIVQDVQTGHQHCFTIERT